MTSYYHKVKGTLEPGQLAKSGDINLIQDSIDDMIKNVIKDNFGPGYILGSDENALKLSPTTEKIDQQHNLFSEEDYTISFYHQYLKQSIDIEKSEIYKINCHLRNTSGSEVTVWGEIRNFKNEIISETHTSLPTAYEQKFQEVSFIFNLKHLPIGRYYFCIRAINISNTQVTDNNIELLDESMFVARYDKEGRYEQGLSTSYDGFNFTDTNDDVDFIDGEVEYILNSDLCFTHYYAHEDGYTYTIQPGAAVVLGEKTLPIDTHITIDKSSGIGDRTDLVLLKPDGRLEIVQGTVYQGEPYYPNSNDGLKLAYITTYKYTGTWQCINCGHINDDLNIICPNCNQTYSPKLPLLEQDDNSFTRTRDVVERVRRLENKMNYVATRNAPTRIKYNCSINPEIADDPDLKRSKGMEKVINNDGNIVIRPTQHIDTTQCYYTLINKDYLTSVSSSVVDNQIEYYDFEGQRIRMTTNIATSQRHKTIDDIIDERTEEMIKEDNSEIILTFYNKTDSDNLIIINQTEAKKGYEYIVYVCKTDDEDKTTIVRYPEKVVHFSVQYQSEEINASTTYSSITDENGKSSFIFNFNEPGDYKVITTCEGSGITGEQIIHVNNPNNTYKMDTKITTSNCTFAIKNGGTFNITLTDINNTPLGNKQLNIVKTNSKNVAESLTVVTNTQGKVALSLTSSIKDTFKISVTFAGDSKYAACTNDSGIVVFDTLANINKSTTTQKTTAKKTTTQTKKSKIKTIVDKYFTKVNNSAAKKAIIVNAFAKCTTYNCVKKVVNTHGSGLPGWHNTRELNLIKEVYKVVK